MFESKASYCSAMGKCWDYHSLSTNRIFPNHSLRLARTHQFLAFRQSDWLHLSGCDQLLHLWSPSRERPADQQLSLLPQLCWVGDEWVSEWEVDHLGNSIGDMWKFGGKAWNPCWFDGVSGMFGLVNPAVGEGVYFLELSETYPSPA